MAEETPDVENGAAEEAHIDPHAMALALAAATQSKLVAAEVENFLKEQTRLTRAQLARIEAQDDHIEEEQRLQLSHLRLRRFSDFSKMALEIAVGLFLFAVVGGFTAMVWQAWGAKGLIVEPLRTPPDIASRGSDGTVLSRQLLDNLNGLVAESDKWSIRAANSYSGNWGDDSKVEIPQTGVSIGELSRSLREWLGHETRVSGELVHTAKGLSLTIRSGTNPALTLNGSEADLEGLMTRTAYALFRQTQPLRQISGAAFSRPHTRADIEEALQLAEFGPPGERFFAWATVSEYETSDGNPKVAEIAATNAIKANSSAFMGYADRNGVRLILGHLEGALADARSSAAMLDHGDLADFNPIVITTVRPNLAGIIADLEGAFADGMAFDKVQLRISGLGLDTFSFAALANDAALDHDPKAASSVLSAHPAWNDAKYLKDLIVFGPLAPKYFLLAAQDRWREAAEAMLATDAIALKGGRTADVRHTYYWPLLAHAWARSGNLKGAEELIARTPHDCTRCLEMRGLIAELAGDRRGAAAWFDRAIKDAPSIPFAYADWGALLLRQGKYDGAIAKFTLANRKGPHFADPLEMWGEALMLKNRSDLALTKFAEAGKYAPNWGRLHLKWGEALFYDGRKEDARAQYRIASMLDLSLAEKVELTRRMRN